MTDIPAQIGAYEVTRELGRGGMGEVYLARDTRLDRHVAIKALPAHLAQDPDRLARFQREAKVLASLNHPGIGAIYGLEEVDGHQYLVLEFVEGETLDEQLARGPIPVDEALPLARQIAEAVEAAHEKGVIHRDLKPGNVMVTPDGVVKVLDFGLARTADDSPTSSSMAIAVSPTATSPAPIHSPTIPGVIMGTAGYMSPEQARGKAVDKRSDIFSFGCVMYEMLTGAGPFPGETVTDSLGAILHREPNWSLLPPHASRRVHDLLGACLAKDRRNRLHDIGDARLELERAIAEPRDVALVATGVRPWWRSAGMLGTVALVALAVLVTALVLLRSSETPSSERTVLRAALALPGDMFLRRSARAIAVSPDGTQVVLSAHRRGMGSRGLMLRDLSSLELRQLAGTEGAVFPFWSPDGESIAFFADGPTDDGVMLKRIDLADGIVRVLCAADIPRGGSWGTRGTIVFAPGAGGGIWTVSDTGGTPTPVTTSTTPGESHRLPSFLPDGERFLYYIQNTTSDGVYAFDPATGESRPVVLGFTEAIFVEPGTLVFARGENLLAQPFDVQRLELTGSPYPIAAGVAYNKGYGYINAGLAPGGTLVYEPVDAERESGVRLAWMDRQGERTMLPFAPLMVSTGPGEVLSNDGRRAVVTLGGERGENSIAVLDLERGIRTPLGDPAVTFTYGSLWGPDERTVIGVEVRDGLFMLVRFPLEGGPGTRIHEAESGFELHSTSSTPDRKTVLFTESFVLDKRPDILTLDLDQDQPPRQFMPTPAGELDPRLSPAGDIVAYVEGNRDFPRGPLKVVAFPAPAAPVQVSANRIWSGSFLWLGPNELAWEERSGGSTRAWSATITVKDGGIDVGPPKPLFDGQTLAEDFDVLDYDASGERFLVTVDDETREQAPLVIVSDWRR